MIEAGASQTAALSPSGLCKVRFAIQEAATQQGSPKVELGNEISGEARLKPAGDLGGQVSTG